MNSHYMTQLRWIRRPSSLILVAPSSLCSMFLFIIRNSINSSNQIQFSINLFRKREPYLWNWIIFMMSLLNYRKWLLLYSRTLLSLISSLALLQLPRSSSFFLLSFHFHYFINNVMNHLRYSKCNFLTSFNPLQMREKQLQKISLNQIKNLFNHFKDIITQIFYLNLIQNYFF